MTTLVTAATAADTSRARRQRGMVMSLGLAGASMSLMHTLVVVLLPELPRALGASITATSWVATVTLLAGGVAVPIAGRLGDMYGKLRMIVVSLVIAIVGSLIAALASTLPVLLVGRALQGLALGVIPLSLSMMRDVFPADQLGRRVAMLNGFTLSLGTGFGPLLMGGVLDRFGWHAVFWVMTVLGACSLLLVLVYVDETPVRAPGGFDLPGALGLSLAIVLLLLAITRGGEWGWTSTSIVTLFAGSVVVGALWVFWERARTGPLVDLEITLRRPVLITHLAGVMVGFTVFLQYVLVFTLVTLSAESGHGLGRSMLIAGMTQVPGAFATVGAAPIAARLARARGPRALLTVGSVAVAAGYLAAVAWHSSLWQIATTATFVYGGVGLAYSALPLLVIANVPVHETAAANSVNNLSRVFGSVVAAAVSSAILAAALVDIGGDRYPAERGFVAIAVVGTIAAAGTALLTRALPAAYRSATA